MPLIVRGQPVGEVISMREAVELMRVACKALAAGALVAPPRMHLRVGRGSLVFTAGGRAADGRGVIGARIYHDLTPRDGAEDQLTVVYDAASGLLKGVVMGSELGEWRTGAIGGVAIDLMAPLGVQNLGVLGSGAQARTQLLAATAVRSFARIRVFSPDAGRRKAFAREMSRVTGQPVEAADSPREAVAEAEVLICATSSTRPVFEAEWLHPLAHINNVGPKRAGAAELPARAFAQAELLATDSLAQLHALGDDFILTGTADASRVVQLSDLLETPSERRPPRRSVFISQGLAGTEVILADEIIERAKRGRRAPAV